MRQVTSPQGMRSVRRSAAGHAHVAYRAWVRAFVLGGTGLVGRAISRRLAAAGWAVEVVGRDPAHFPVDLAESGARFVAADRSDARALATAFGGGADLLVDCVCFTRSDAEILLPLAANAASTVMISSKAVYVDAAGRHSNSDEPPRYDGPIRETQPTLSPGDMDFDSREGYGPKQGGCGTGSAGQRSTGDSAASIEDPRRRGPPAARVGVRQASARSS